MYHIAVAVATTANGSVMWHTLHNLLYFSVFGCKKDDKTFGGHLTAHLYENCFVLFVWFCVAVIEFAFGVLERRVTEGERTLGGVCYNKVVMWGFVSVC